MLKCKNSFQTMKLSDGNSMISGIEISGGSNVEDRDDLNKLESDASTATGDISSVPFSVNREIWQLR